MKIQEITLEQVSSTEAVNNAIKKQWIFEEFNDSLNTLRDWVLEELDVTIESYGDLTTEELDKLEVIEMRILDDLFSRTCLLEKISYLEGQLEQIKRTIEITNEEGLIIMEDLGIGEGFISQDELADLEDRGYGINEDGDLIEVNK